MDLDNSAEGKRYRRLPIAQTQRGKRTYTTVSRSSFAGMHGGPEIGYRVYIICEAFDEFLLSKQPHGQFRTAILGLWVCAERLADRKPSCFSNFLNSKPAFICVLSVFPDVRGPVGHEVFGKAYEFLGSSERSHPGHPLSLDVFHS